MRLFVAIDPSEAVRNRLVELLTEFATATRQAQAEIKWVKPEQLHFTLKFLGECSEERVPVVIQGLKAALVDAMVFPVRVGGLGTFPETGPLRIVWVGLREGGEAVKELAMHIELALTSLGFPTEDRSFSPHLTLGRVKSVKNTAKLRALIDQHSAGELGSFGVDALHLYRSVLSPKGPTYSILETVTLRADG